MKVTRVFLSAVLVVVCFCILQTAAGPFTQVHEDQVKSEAPQINHLSTETSLEQRNPLALFRSKRQSHLSLCRYCCNCCHNKGCGFCCKF